MKTKKYKNQYTKHIPVSERVWAELREIKVKHELHSINEVVKYLLERTK